MRELTTTENADKSAFLWNMQMKELDLLNPILEHQKIRRDIEDAYIGRILRMWNVKTLMRSAEAVGQS